VPLTVNKLFGNFTMSICRISVIVSALALVLSLTPQSRADLSISVDGVVKSTDPGNTFTSFNSGASLDGFNISTLTMEGVNAFGGGPTLFDISGLEVSTGGAGTLKLSFTETNLTPASFEMFSADLSAVLSNVDVTRSIYLDASNKGAETTLLYTSDDANGKTSLLPLPLDGAFSLVEEIDLTATGAGASFSVDDKSFANPVVAAVPEPSSVALLCGGLVGATPYFDRSAVA
jgi:hypothetical protein